MKTKLKEFSILKVGDGSGEGSGGSKARGRGISKTLVHLFIMCSLVSCAFKNADETPKKNSEVSIIRANEIIGSTGDGISDETKSELGLNHNIAYFPRLSVYLVKEISLGAIFKEKSNFVENDEDYLMLTQQYTSTDSTRGGDLDLLKVLRKKILINQYNFLRNIRAEDKDTITDEDLKSSILSDWSDDQYYGYRKKLGQFSGIQANISGKLRTIFKIKVRSSKGVSQVSNVKLKSFFYDFKNLKSNEIYSHYLLKDSGAKETIDLGTSRSEYVPATNYNLFANEIKNLEVQQKINGRNEIGLEFEDFDYKVAGRELNYSKVISNIIDKCAKIVISNGKLTEVFYVAPNYNLKDTLSILGKAFVQNKDGTIDSLDNLQTSISQPIEFDSLKGSDLAKGVWSIFGESDNLSDQLKAKGFYFISYSTMKELLDSSRRELKLAEKKDADQVNIERVLMGDEVTLKLDSLIYKTMKESMSLKIQGPVCTGSACNFVDDINRGPECKCTKECADTISSPTIVNNIVDLEKIKLSEILNITDEYGNQIKADVFSFEKYVVIKFNYPLPQLKNKLSISFKDPEDKLYFLRSGSVSTTCPDGRPNYSNVAWKNNYEFKYSATIFGALKY